MVEAQVARLGVDVDGVAVRGGGVAAEDLPGGADEVVGRCGGGVGLEPLAGFGGGEEGV